MDGCKLNSYNIKCCLNVNILINIDKLVNFLVTFK